MDTIVVLHGWGHDKRSWEDFARRWEEGLVVTFDLPGFGGESSRAGWGIPEYAAWVIEKIRPLRERGAVILLGHSFGGRIAAYLATQNPSWLSKLILYGAPILYRPSFATRLRIGIARLLKHLLPSPQLRKKLAMRYLQSEVGHGDYETFKKTVSFDLSQDLSRITVPTLLLCGENDREAAPAIAREAHARIKGSVLAVLPRVGHNIHTESPELFYGTVKNFIAGS